MNTEEKKEDNQNPGFMSPVLPPREPAVVSSSNKTPTPKTPPQVDQKKRTQLGSSNPVTPQQEQSKKVNPLLLLSSGNRLNSKPKPQTESTSSHIESAAPQQEPPPVKRPSIITPRQPITISEEINKKTETPEPNTPNVNPFKSNDARVSPEPQISVITTDPVKPPLHKKSKTPEPATPSPLVMKVVTPAKVEVLKTKPVPLNQKPKTPAVNNKTPMNAARHLLHRGSLSKPLASQMNSFANFKEDLDNFDDTLLTPAVNTPVIMTNRKTSINPTKLTDGKDIVVDPKDLLPIDDVPIPFDHRTGFIADIEKKLTDETIPPYIDEFLDEADRSALIVGSYPIEEIKKQEMKLEEERLKEGQAVIERYRKREQNLANHVQNSKQEVMKEYITLRSHIIALEKQCSEQQEKRRNTLHEVFNYAENKMINKVRSQEGDVRDVYGEITLDNPNAARKFHAEYNHLPQPVHIKLLMMRAVKERLQAGRYLWLLTMYDRLGGHPMKWTTLGYTGIPHLKDNSNSNTSIGATKPVWHNGKFYNTQLTFNQDLFASCPSKNDARPSYCFILELFWLGNKRSPVDKVVGWTVLPMVDSNFEIVKGKYKLPVLKGEVNMHIDKYTSFENQYSNNLDTWLGNLYLEITHLPREQILVNHHVNEYDAEIAYNTELLQLQNDQEMYEGVNPTKIKEVSVPEELYEKKDNNNGIFSCFRRNNKKEKVDEDSSSNNNINNNGINIKASIASSVVTKQSIDTATISTNINNKPNNNPSVINNNNNSTGVLRSRSHIPSTADLTQSVVNLNNVPSTASVSSAKTRGSTFFSQSNLNTRKYMEVNSDEIDVSQYLYEVKRFNQIDMVTTRMQEGIKKTKYIKVELMHDLGLDNWKSLEFWLTLIILVIAFILRIWLHYLGQYIYLKALRVPVYDFTFMFYTAVMKYIQEAIPLEIEILEVCIGPLTNIIVFIILMMIGWLCRKMLGGVTDVMSKFLCWWGVCTFFDPLLILLVDLISHNYDCSRLSRCSDVSSSDCTCSGGDAMKLYLFFKRTEGNGIVGVFITILIYGCLMTLAFFALYTYMLYIHMNGRMLDIYRRLNGSHDTFYIPDDFEISSNELIFICSKANKWTSPEGTQKRIGVCTYTLTDPLDRSYKEITTHLTIYEQELNGIKKLDRHFLRLPDGTILELFGNMMLNYGPQYNALEKIILHSSEEKTGEQNVEKFLNGLNGNAKVDVRLVEH